MERPRLRSLRELRRVPREQVRRSAEREGGSGMRGKPIPDFAEPVLGLAEGKTRGLHPGYARSYHSNFTLAARPTSAQVWVSVSMTRAKSAAVPPTVGVAIALNFSFTSGICMILTISPSSLATMSGGV